LSLDPKVQANLDHFGITAEVLECDPEFADTAAFCEKYGFAAEDAANTILVAGKANPKRFAACVVLATTKLDVNKAVCGLLEVRRASFASGDQTTQLTGMMIGGVTVFGLPEDLPVYIDEHVMARSRVVMGGGNRSSKLVLSPAELLKLPRATAVAELALPR
jgi:prolyl-tRNA editing enzyme YbaK/EbsC (Cys-tRNA(Pro) deacylase)